MSTPYYSEAGITIYPLNSVHKCDNLSVTLCREVVTWMRTNGQGDIEHGDGGKMSPSKSLGLDWVTNKTPNIPPSGNGSENNITLGKATLSQFVVEGVGHYEDSPRCPVNRVGKPRASGTMLTAILGTMRGRMSAFCAAESIWQSMCA